MKQIKKVEEISIEKQNKLVGGQSNCVCSTHTCNCRYTDAADVTTEAQNGFRLMLDNRKK